MDYFNDFFTTFLGLGRISCVAVYAGSESSRISSKYLNLCSEDERRSCGFGTTWGWVINDRIYIFGWTIPLKCIHAGQINQATFTCVHNPTKDSAIYVCLHAHALPQIILYCSSASCLTHNVSLCTCTVCMWSIRIVCIVCIFYLYL